MMKKLLALLVMALMASPLFAASTITISAVDAGSGILRVSYTVDAASDSDPVGMALNFACSDAATTVAADVTNVDPLFPVYLDYAHDAGSGYNFVPVTGSPLAISDAAGVPAAAVSNFAICVGRLGQAAPTKGAAHVLCDIKLTQGSAAYTDVTIAADSLRGGVVGSTFVVNVPATAVRVTFAVPDCFTGSAADLAQWNLVGKPDCWCASKNPRQCLGDANNAKQGKNNYWVSTDDFSILSAAWNKNFAGIQGVQTLGVDQICADFNHQPQGKNNYRVSTDDFTILSANWQITNGPAATCP